MTDPSAALEALVEAVAERVARHVLAAAAEQAPSRLIPLRESPVGYRLTLAAIKSGDLTKYTVGGRSYIERVELESWILSHPVRQSPPAVTSAPDEVDRVLATARRRTR